MTSNASPSAEAASRKFALAGAMRTLGMLPALVLISILFQILSGYVETGTLSWSDGRFMSWNNLSIVAQQASINTVLAAGMTFVILTGGIDLSVGSVLAASAMVAMMASLVPGLSALSIPVALAAGTGFGLINGALIAALRLPPFIVTLGTMTSVRGLARLFGNDNTIFNSSLDFAPIGNGTIFGVPWLVIIAIATVVISWLILRRTVLGMRIYAVGGNPEASRLAGIKVWLITLFVYGISAHISQVRR